MLNFKPHHHRDLSTTVAADVGAICADRHLYEDFRSEVVANFIAGQTHSKDLQIFSISPKREYICAK